MFNRAKYIFTIAFHKPFDSSTEENRAKERERRLALTSITAVIQKVLATCIPLITIRITLNYLGAEVYGLWNTVMNFFALFAFSDLGLGNGLQTKLSNAYGKNELLVCRQLISTTYLILIVVATVLMLLFLFVFPFINWRTTMNATETESIQLVASVVLVIVLPKLLSIPIAIIGRTQYALQEGYNSNLWSALGSCVTLLYIFIVARYDLGKITLLLGSAVIPVFIASINMLVYFGSQRKEFQPSFKLANKEFAKELLELGISFCMLSILTTVGLSMDTYIVAKTIDLSQAGSFSILYKISLAISSVLAIFSQPLWGANGEALARGDIQWVKKNTSRMSLLMTVLTLAFSLLLIAVSKPMFKLWLGESFSYSTVCLLFMCLMQMLQAFISPYFMVLNACGIVKKQLLLFMVYTPASFILKFIAARSFGIDYIPAVGAVLYLLVIVNGTYYITQKQLKHIVK